MKTLIKIFILFLFLSNISFAQKDTGHDTHAHNHHAAMFLGMTKSLNNSHMDFSIGLDYEYMFHFTKPTTGIGVFGEVVFAEHTEILFGVPLFVHPMESWRMWIAPGVMMGEHEVHETDNGAEHKIKYPSIQAEDAKTESFNKFLFRIGTAYDFHYWGASFSPTINFDFVEGKSFFVFGVSFGYGF